ncbi:MAG: class I tRNA ligase family protein, partial [Candidatus Absconditabacterales bacterium]
MVNFSKKYDHNVQNQIYNSYKENGKFCYKLPKTKKEQKDDTMIFQLPFDASEKIGFGSAFKIILQDIFVKYLNISGNNVLNSPFMYYSGLSHNKKNNYNQNLKILNKQKDDNLKIMKLLGLSMDFDKALFSFSEVNSIKIRKLFIDLVDKSIISNQPFVSYRSNEQQTILSEDEIKFQKIKGKKYNLRYFIDTKKDLLIVPTTNPETIFADVALAVNPLDGRYKKFIRSKVIIPIV